MTTLRRVLTILAGFVLAIHVAVLFHELGHAMGYWVAGGRVTGIVMLAPLPAGYVRGYAMSTWQMVYGGVVFGTAVTVLPLLLARWIARNSVAWFWLMMWAACCLAHNGLYLFVGGIAPFGDAEGMVNRGAPRWALMLLGLPLLAGFVELLGRALGKVGMKRNESVRRWMGISLLGLLPLPLLTVLPVLFSAGQRSMHRPMLIYILVYTACFVLGILRARARGTEQMMPQTWRAAIVLGIGAVLVIGLELVAFRPG